MSYEEETLNKIFGLWKETKKSNDGLPNIYPPQFEGFFNKVKAIMDEYHTKRDLIKENESLKEEIRKIKSQISPRTHWRD